MQHESYASRPDPCENRNFVGGKALSGETGPHIGFRLCLLAMGWLKAVFFFSSHETFLKATLSAECSGARDYLSVMNRLPEEYFRGLRKPVSPYNFSANGSCASF